MGPRRHLQNQVTSLRDTLIYVRNLRQNVTLSVPVDLLKDAKVMAAQRGTSLSALMVEGLKRAVRDDERFAEAARRIKKRLQRGFDLGTNGKALPRRAELHER